MKRAYSGLRVLDLGQGVAAPYCAMLLALHGAEVVKLEPPEGDWSRGLGTRRGDHTAMSAHYNRGKRGLALDLKAPAGRELALALASRADVVIEGFRPGVAARLGLGWPEMNVPTGAYRTRDGWIMIALVREEQFARLAGALGRPDLAQDPRFADFTARAAHAAPLCADLAEWFRGDTTEAWLARLRAADILADRVNGFDDWLADPHVAATGGAIAVDQPGMGRFLTPRTPGVAADVEQALSTAPGIGEHSRAILAELGVAAAEIDRLAAAGVVR